jgi:phosphoglycerate dehydrogenase-like enzyme
MPRRTLVALASKPLFQSFFTASHQKALSLAFNWTLNGSREVTPAMKKQLATAEALITTWDSPCFGDELLQLAPNLRIVAHCGGEVKKRFTGSLLDKLTITTAPEPMARATAELAAALVLYCGRGIDAYRGALRKRNNKIYDDAHLRGTPESLIGREIGMIGFGRIGRKIVDLLRGFDLRWRVYDPYASREGARDSQVEFVELRPLLRAADLLVLAAALTDETRGLLGRRNLARLPNGATVINVARGAVLDLDALTNEVRKGRLQCAIDVTDPVEPLSPAHPLRNLPGAVVTPHIGGGTSKARHEMADDLVDDLKRFFRGETVKNRVTTAMLSRMT